MRYFTKDENRCGRQQNKNKGGRFFGDGDNFNITNKKPRFQGMVLAVKAS